MNALGQALETSIFLTEKVAAHPTSPAWREKRALADFAAFGLYKRAALDPAALKNLQKGLGWGVGLGLPALGVGHLMARDARHQGEELLRDARNQALLTAAGVGGMQALGGLLKRSPSPTTHNLNVSSRHEQVNNTVPPQTPNAMTPDMMAQLAQFAPSEQKLASAILVDDVLEAACDLPDADAKHAALVALIEHRSEAMEILRGLIS